MSTPALQRRSTRLFVASVVTLALCTLFGFMLAMAMAMAPGPDGLPYGWAVGTVFAIGATVCAWMAMRRGFDTQGPRADPAVIQKGWRLVIGAGVLLVIGIVVASLNLGTWQIG